MTIVFGHFLGERRQHGFGRRRPAARIARAVVEPENPAGLRSIENQGVKRRKIERLHRRIVGRRAKDRLEPLARRLVDDLVHGIGFVLKHEKVAGAEIGEHLVDVRRRERLVGAGKVQNAVLPVGDHLNHRVAGGIDVGDGDARDIDAFGFEKALEEDAVAADHAGMGDVKPRMGERRRLIEPLAARMNGAARCGKRFAAAKKMRNGVDVIDVDRTKIDDAGGHGGRDAPIEVTAVTDGAPRTGRREKNISGLRARDEAEPARA